MMWVEHVACIKETRNAYKILAGKREGWRPHGRPRCMWDDNIKMDVKEIVWYMDWIHVAEDWGR
jgi:hypothetical protein